MIKESYVLVDTFAQKENLFTRVDARIKIIFTLLAIILNLAIPGLKFPLLIFITAMAAFNFLKVPWQMLFSRLMPPLLLSTVVILMDTFLLGHNVIFRIHIGHWVITGHEDGFYIGLLLAARVLGSISLILALSFSTPVNQIMSALTWFRVPKVLVEIFQLTYRYLFVFWDEGLRIRQAQVLRLGYPKWNRFRQWEKAMRSTSVLLGMILIRAYDRAEGTYQAMQVRGYKGNFVGNVNNQWSPGQWKYGMVGLSLLIIMAAVSYS